MGKFFEYGPVRTLSGNLTNTAMGGQSRDQSGIAVRILGADEADRALWQAYVARTPGATLYHDIAWRQIFARAFGYRGFLLLAQDGGGAVHGVLPLYHVPGLLGPDKLSSVPFRDRGGILHENDAAFLALAAAADDLRRAMKLDAVELKTLAPYPEPLVREAGLARHDHWIHSEVDLTDLAPDTLRQKLGDKTRNMIRQAERAGLQFSEDAAALDSWMALHRASQHNLGIPAFPRRFFESVLAGLGSRARLFLVRGADSEAAAACICYLEKDRLIYAYSAAHPRGRELRANDLMLVSLLDWARAQGLRWFDFGSDAPDQEGLLFFKRKWLARQSPIPVYALGAASLSDSSHPRYRLARALVRAAPAPIGRMLLAPVLRYLG